MQNDNEKFDLLVRSMMQDAEEPVSPRVWENVSAGLDSRKRRPVFVWYAAGLAAAAALVLGVVLRGTHDDNSNLPIHIQTAPVALDSPVPANTVPDAGTAHEPVLTPVSNLLADGDTRPKTPKKDGHAASGAEPRQEGRPDGTRPDDIWTDGDRMYDDRTDKADDTRTDGAWPDDPRMDKTDGLLPEADAVRESLSVETGDRGPSQAGTDPFARMEWEDTHRHQRQGASVSFNVGGGLKGSENTVTAPFNIVPGSPDDQTLAIINPTTQPFSYAIPISVGLGARFGLGSRWAIGTGLNWTLLQSSFMGTIREDGINPVSSEILNTLHYVGIPVNAYFSILQGGRVELYAFAGGSIEKGLSNRFRSVVDRNFFHKEGISGVQWSVAGGFGVQFRLTRQVGLYVDPSLRWYVPSDQPKSIRTQQPLMMNFEVGLRYNL